jgi:hypothetical protein
MSNRCEGLPTGSCPDNRCYKSVKFTTYDLFLCQSCEKTRDADRKKTRVAESKTATEFKEVCSKKAGKQLTKKQLGKDVSSSCVNSAISASPPVTNDGTGNTRKLRQTSPVSQSVVNEAAVGDSADLNISTIKALTIEIAQLKEAAANQDVIIKSLTDKLNFVLSYLEIDSDSQSKVSAPNAETKPSAPQPIHTPV